MSHNETQSGGPIESTRSALAAARAMREQGNISRALDILEEIALDEPTLSIEEACQQDLDAMLDGITSPQDLATYHRAKGYLALGSGEDELAAAHLSISLRFAPSAQALDTLERIRQYNGRDFPITTYDDAVRLMVTSRIDMGPTERIVELLRKELDEARERDDAYAAQQAAKKLYDLTLDRSYLI